MAELCPKLQIMVPKESILHSVVTGSCPRCHSGKMYVNANPYNISQTMKMHEHCSHCGLQFKIEPNFFFGAMYVSYGVSVLAALAIFLSSHYIFEANLKTSFAAIFIGLIVLMPLITRVSRNLYINLFVSYRRELAE